MKKVLCFVLLFSVFMGVIYAQSVPKFGEAILSSNKEKAKSLMKENGFNNVGLTMLRCKELDNALCDVISGTSKWCPMCHVFYKKGSIIPSLIKINLVSYLNDNAAANAWKNAGYTIIQSLPSEYTHILVRDLQGQKYSFVARVQILSTPNGTNVNTQLMKILTPD